MNNKMLLGFILAFIVTAACSIFDNENDLEPISAIVEDDEFLIRNNLNEDIYYFAVNENTLAVILWVPTVTDSNKVESETTQLLSTSDILGYSSDANHLLFYWDEDISEVLSIPIE